MKDYFFGFMVSDRSMLRQSFLENVLALYGGKTISNNYSYVSPLLTKQETADISTFSTTQHRLPNFLRQRLLVLLPHGLLLLQLAFFQAFSIFSRLFSLQSSILSPLPHFIHLSNRPLQTHPQNQEWDF